MFTDPSTKRYDYPSTSAAAGYPAPSNFGGPSPVPDYRDFNSYESPKAQANYASPAPTRAASPAYTPVPPPPSRTTTQPSWPEKGPATAFLLHHACIELPVDYDVPGDADLLLAINSANANVLRFRNELDQLEAIKATGELETVRNFSGTGHNAAILDSRCLMTLTKQIHKATIKHNQEVANLEELLQRRHDLRFVHRSRTHIAEMAASSEKYDAERTAEKQEYELAERMQRERIRNSGGYRVPTWSPEQVAQEQDLQTYITSLRLCGQAHRSQAEATPVRERQRQPY